MRTGGETLGGTDGAGSCTGWRLSDTALASAPMQSAGEPTVDVVRAGRPRDPRIDAAELDVTVTALTAAHPTDALGSLLADCARAPDLRRRKPQTHHRHT